MRSRRRLIVSRVNLGHSSTHTIRAALRFGRLDAVEWSRPHVTRSARGSRSTARSAPMTSRWEISASPSAMSTTPAAVAASCCEISASPSAMSTTRAAVATSRWVAATSLVLTASTLPTTVTSLATSATSRRPRASSRRTKTTSRWRRLRSPQPASSSRCTRPLVHRTGTTTGPPMCRPKWCARFGGDSVGPITRCGAGLGRTSDTDATNLRGCGGSTR